MTTQTISEEQIKKILDKNCAFLADRLLRDYFLPRMQARKKLYAPIPFKQLLVAETSITAALIMADTAILELSGIDE